MQSSVIVNYKETTFSRPIMDSFVNCVQMRGWTELLPALLCNFLRMNFKFDPRKHSKIY